MRKDHATRQSEIVDTALQLMAEGGSAAVTTQAIADRMAVSQATVFRHFERRADIFREAIERTVAGVFGDLDEAFGAPFPPDRRLRRVIDVHLRAIAANRGIPRLLFSDRLHLEDAALKDVVLAAMVRYRSQLARLLTEGRDDGVFRPGLDANETAGLIVSLVQGLVLRWSLTDFAFPLERESDAVWSLLWHGVRAT
jgi:AcrR family transcriptional regulator